MFQLDINKARQNMGLKVVDMAHALGVTYNMMFNICTNKIAAPDWIIGRLFETYGKQIFFDDLITKRE